MAKYHINEKGEVGVCRATKNPCRFGGVQSHFASKEEARKAYEIKMSLGKNPKRNLPPIIIKSNNINPPEDWDLEILSSIKGEASVRDITGKIVGGGDFPKTFEDVFDRYEKLTKSKYSLFVQDLKKAYYDSNNAIDDMGILQHVREKGFDTKGLTPNEAVKKMLREENCKYVSFVEKSTGIDVKNIAFSSLKKAERHFERIEPSQPTIKNSNSKEFMGVVYEMPDGDLRLLDGHHRVKYQTQKNISGGLFIVLSH